MDKTRFTANAPGKLVEVQIPNRGNDWAFIPSELPTEWTFPKELWPLAAEAAQQIGQLNGVGMALLSNPELLLHPLQTREAITSSSLEGTYVSPAEYLMFDEEDEGTHNGHPPAPDDWVEVHNYKLALVRGMKLLETLPICSRLIREMHKVLMGGVRGHEKTPGEFRKKQVHVGAGYRYIPPPYPHISPLISNLEKYANMELEGVHNLVKCYVFHYQLETIHPFSDGNGRIGRAVLALMLFKLMGLHMPWLYMSAFFEKYKSEYIDKLFYISADGRWNDWIEFCLQGTIEQAKDGIRRCHAFKTLKKKYHARITEHGASSRSHDTIERLFQNPIITMPKLCRWYKISQPTARCDVDRLIKAGIIQEGDQGQRPIHFFAHELIAAAYGDGA